ncbi:VOC family protein [Thiofilum flexile]|uniref:VOC family protein n=1 Tax=Thiofilum flexile TaxID=125627 RepID=UPI00036C67B2|nr:VOC family protein [Thiofilum flexile]
MLTLLVLRCEDIDKTKHFYEQLGLSFREEKHGTGARHFSTILNGIVLEFYPASSHYSVDKARLGFNLPNLAQLPCYNPDLLIHRDEQILLIIKDPDGRTLELGDTMH